MSAITETETGGEMVCILQFTARRRDLQANPIPGERRTFRIGERVRYVNHFFKNTPEDNPTGYMAVFEPLDPKDKNHYAAAQTYFVSLDCWEGLKKHFASSLIVMERDRAVGGPGLSPNDSFQKPGFYVLVEANEGAVDRAEGKPARRRNGSRKGA